MTYPYEPSGGTEPSWPNQPYGYDPKGSPTGQPTPGQPMPGHPTSGQPTPGYSTFAQPAPGYPAGYPGYGYAPPAPTNGLAIAALVCAIAGVATCVTAPVGAILGHVARRQIPERGEGGDGLALAGIIVGWIITALYGALGALWLIAVVLVASAESGDFAFVLPALTARAG